MGDHVVAGISLLMLKHVQADLNLENALAKIDF